MNFYKINCIVVFSERETCFLVTKTTEEKEINPSRVSFQILWIVWLGIRILHTLAFLTLLDPGLETY